MASHWWQHFRKDGNHYKNNKSNWNAYCKSCIRVKIAELVHDDNETADHEGTWGVQRDEDDLFRTVISTTIPRHHVPSICGKVDTLIEHLTQCPNIGLALKTSAQEDKARRKQEARCKVIRKVMKENVPAASSSPSQVPQTPTSSQPRHPLMPTAPSTLSSVLGEPALKRVRTEGSFSAETDPFLGNIVASPRWGDATITDFAADMCRLFVACNVSWHAADHSYFRSFFSKWVPGCIIPGRKQLSGRILDGEVIKIVGEMKGKVQGRYATGQCDGWKNIAKTSIIACMVNVEFTPYLLNIYDISTEAKNAENLLKIVLLEVAYCTTVLGIHIAAWCTDASGESLKMRRLLRETFPWIVVVDCWSHQVNLVVGDFFKQKDSFVSVMDDALKVIKFFNNHGKALGILKEQQQSTLGKVFALFLPVLTRWTSHYLSACRLLEVEQQIRMICLTKRHELVLSGGAKREEKEKAESIMKIIEQPDFWKDLKRVKQHLEPLAIAANITQSNHANLGVVLITLANLFRIYSGNNDFDRDASATICASLEKRWAKVGVEREIFILAIILNPYLRTRPFNSHNRTMVPGRLWDMVRRAYIRMYSVQPDMRFRQAFGEYLQGTGEFSAESLGLSDWTELAKQEGTDVDLISVWRPFDSREENGPNGLVRLAMRVLSIVPNSAATERIFSKMGAVHTKARNRQHAEKVRKIVILKEDTNERWGVKARKRKFGDIEDVSESPSTSDFTEGTTTAATIPSSTNTSSTNTSATNAIAGEDTHSANFHTFAQELVEEAAADDRIPVDSDSTNCSPTSTAHPLPNDISEKEGLLLRNLFFLPDSSARVPSSLVDLTAFWDRGAKNLETEVTYNESFHREPDSI